MASPSSVLPSPPPTPADPNPLSMSASSILSRSTSLLPHPPPPSVLVTSYRTRLRDNPISVLALSTFALIATAAFLQHPFLIWGSKHDLCVLVLKTVCAYALVRLGYTLLAYFEWLDWTYVYKTGEVEDEAEKAILEASTTHADRNTSGRPATVEEVEEDVVIPPTPLLPSSMRTPGTNAPGTPSNPRTAFRVPLTRADPRPAHHSGILGPSPYPQRFMPTASTHNTNVSHQSSQSSPSDHTLRTANANTNAKAVFSPLFTVFNTFTSTTSSPSPNTTPTPIADPSNPVPLLRENQHPRKSGFNGTPAPLTFKHFNGNGFVENMERLREVRMRMSGPPIREEKE
ncbi:hypothetical protein K458DRAFT_492507 [Lentithecium fluviatile CBS 122367]|uniref:Uncharacterized protein n=1 Tax=Lentithecium fluviatile CBS 122367 TaxID=1168545 RepID=A0A6G1IDK9_9PLEO|nr:hypothetical protein K458DRAFT_492507 [Lentithecium fluviatile CBS 122367]